MCDVLVSIANSLKIIADAMTMGATPTASAPPQTAVAPQQSAPEAPAQTALGGPELPAAGDDPKVARKKAIDFLISKGIAYNTKMRTETLVKMAMDAANPDSPSVPAGTAQPDASAPAEVLQPATVKALMQDVGAKHGADKPVELVKKYGRGAPKFASIIERPDAQEIYRDIVKACNDMLNPAPETGGGEDDF